MNRLPLLILFLIAGCSGAADSPSIPPFDAGSVPNLAVASEPYRCWGLYALQFDEDHTTCEIVPVRAGNFHLNAVRLLEGGPCTNCVKIESITPKGDGIIDVNIRITHPYFSLVYSAFDVKGIVMFTGTSRITGHELWQVNPVPHNLYIGWWRHGDWELLNPDGWTFRWGPNWNPDAQFPIMKYWPGKLSIGTPTTDINAYKNFYTDEERHLFRPNHSVTQTYTIKTQPGPLTVGYAVEACWEPPITTPVVNPLTDFPPSANQPEPYLFEVVINDGEPVGWPKELEDNNDGSIKMYIEQWGDVTVNEVSMWTRADYHPPGKWSSYLNYTPFVNCQYPDVDYYCGMHYYLGGIENPYPGGWYRTLNMVCWGNSMVLWHDHAFTVTDFYFNNPD